MTRNKNDSPAEVSSIAVVDTERLSGAILGLVEGLRDCSVYASKVQAYATEKGGKSLFGGSGDPKFVNSLNDAVSEGNDVLKELEAAKTLDPTSGIDI